MEILYEDSSVIVVIKPQGMLSQADKKRRREYDNKAAKSYRRRNLPRPPS